MNILLIDTSSNKEIVVGVRIGEKEHFFKRKITFQKAQVLLPMVDTLLKRHGLTIHAIDSINVNVGPGSFTGLRVGVSVANSLAFTLGILVNGKKQVSPIYLLAPH